MAEQEIVKCWKTLQMLGDGRLAGGYGNGAGLYTLPIKRVSKWYPRVEGVRLCASGYHACLDHQLIYHLSDFICPAELRGGIVRDDDKIAGQQIRLYPVLVTWNKQTARLFAADCAEQALGAYRELRPHDDRPELAIRAARQYAYGLIGDAASAAASAAAWAAARAAAWGAASAAARAAAWGAASAVARAAAREWQSVRLWQYLNGEVDLIAIRESVS